MMTHRLIAQWFIGIAWMTMVGIAGGTAFSEVYQGAPPEFTYQSNPVVAVDFETVDIYYEFNSQTRQTSATAVVNFNSEQAGFPMFDLVPNPTALRLNGQELPSDALVLTSDPTRVTQFRVLTASVEANSQNTLEIEYRLRSSDVTHTNGRVRAGFFMSDLANGGRRFFEQYGPANFEFDHVRYQFHVKVVGTSIAHEVFVNGQVEELGPNEWLIQFPDYFTASSPYFHLTEQRRFFINRFTYQGLEREIPVVVYSGSSSLTSQGSQLSRRVMTELEDTYGPYMHDQAVVYVTSSGGGMEYGGATMTSLRALGHEFTHFWFARGVMPANGNAGWIDEAVASWRDNGYPRAARAPARAPVNLGGFSPYRRETSRDSYALGSRLMSEFDFMFRDQGGMRPILRTLYEESQGKTITVGDFKQFVERVSGADLTAIFNRYVYGRRQLGEEKVNEHGLRLESAVQGSHPRPYTAEELRHYR